MEHIEQTWLDLLDDRDQKEVQFAKIYAADFHHGTAGHNRLMLIAKLAGLLDECLSIEDLDGG